MVTRLDKSCWPFTLSAPIAQLAERIHGKDEVTSSSLVGSSIGPMVKRLRHRPFTAVTRVRIPLGSPAIFPT